ncbi:MAG TPA: RMD1 family protein [Rhizomicrobium sp.]|nr:RMD1 family protein [Rhizomicrobium sp.]
MREEADGALAIHAMLIGDRLAIDRSGFSGVVSAAPFCYRKGGGYVVVFRYGALVLIGLSADNEKEALSQFSGEISKGAVIEEERLRLEIRAGQEEGIAAGGILYLKELTPAHALVIGDILAKSVALARYEREIAAVFDTIEPTATDLAIKGRLPRARKALLQLIGSALLAQHRVSGRIAFAEKPEALWDHPELERFYARLEDEYEIVERGTLLNGKVSVVGSAAQTFTDMMDTARSTRLEFLIVILIFAELIIAAVALFHP